LPDASKAGQAFDLNPQARRVRAEEKISGASLMREEIFLPLRFSGRGAQRHRKICKSNQKDLSF